MYYSLFGVVNLTLPLDAHTNWLYSWYVNLVLISDASNSSGSLVRYKHDIYLKLNCYHYEGTKNLTPLLFYLMSVCRVWINVVVGV